MTDSVNLRAVVLDILTEVNDKGEYTHLLINSALTKYQYLDKNQRAFISKVALGTVERKIELDYVINQFSKTPVKKMKPVISNILRMSVYQLLYMDNVPDSACCNEAVKLAQRRGFAGLKGFVNGVLRSIARNKCDIKYPDENKDLVAHLSIKYSMPEWIVKRFLEELGKETTISVFEGFCREKMTYIRCNTFKCSPDELRARLNDEGVKVYEAKAGLDYAFKISDYDHISGLKSFNEGLFQVQDISSIIAGSLAGINEGDFVIDVCGAPGGKSINAALLAGKNGKVITRDISDYKAELIRSNVSRMGIDNVEVQVWDACKLDEKMIESADVVIADLPCSGLGVIGRKPDIKYNIDEAGLESLVKLQRQMLKVVSRYVKPGKYLAFSTCTINRDENMGNVLWICDNLGFELEESKTFLPFGFSDGDELNCDGLNCDGFFVARLRKI